MKDQAFERLTAPPSPVVTSRSSLLKDVIEQQTEVIEAQDRLIALWTSFRAERLALYHDLGVLPYNDWKSFLADLSAGARCRRRPSGAGPRPTAGTRPDDDTRRPPALPESVPRSVDDDAGTAPGPAHGCLTPPKGELQ